ncbi:MAG: hypothetical protein QOE66_2586 [Chloroflexota bacterium]|jgi:hypothetical protein|nr:hypothetical protein [Chloroflexota bacterium]
MLQLPGGESGIDLGGGSVQSAYSRDVGALALVVALFLVLFVLSVTLGSPAH